MPRYRKYNILYNSSEYYSFLRTKRDLKGVRQYETPVMRQPSVNDRIGVPSTTYIWKYGDRFYKLAHTHYGDPTYWWIIAWYNGFATEVDIKNGDLISIPLSLEDALRVLGIA
jgi:hypothetical protein